MRIRILFACTAAFLLSCNLLLRLPIIRWNASEGQRQEVLLRLPQHLYQQASSPLWCNRLHEYLLMQHEGGLPQ